MRRQLIHLCTLFLFTLTATHIPTIFAAAKDDKIEIQNAGGLLKIPPPGPSNRVSDLMQTSEGALRLMPLYHGSVMAEFNGKTIYIDPWSFADYTGLPQADMIVMTHTHADHLDPAIISRIKKQTETVFVGTDATIDTLNLYCAPGCGVLKTVNDNEKLKVMGIGIEGVPMYNSQLGSAPEMPFHHKGVGSGYVLIFGDIRVYFSGDTECIPEMKMLKDINIAFLAMSPTRTMTPIKAAECTKAFKPDIVYPYHYLGSDPQEFADAVKDTGITVRLRKLEGEPQ